MSKKIIYTDEFGNKILIWTTLKNMFGPSLMRFQKLSQFLQKIIKNRSNTKMYVLPHGTKSIL